MADVAGGCKREREREVEVEEEEEEEVGEVDGTFLAVLLGGAGGQVG